ncbi:hypothetical protein SAMN05216324_13814 [Chryseobacterium limigenitum]|uniref:Uncharacterized protein n=1 Tax=Chryseobacterium limigenitum TaxID=1612149 RepID=A0A1K2IZ71_9FLAO|nr:hypothetical protein SAMN05216324_13814 [Chryseobacterium limigenitum]
MGTLQRFWFLLIVISDTKMRERVDEKNSHLMNGKSDCTNGLLYRMIRKRKLAYKHKKRMQNLHSCNIKLKIFNPLQK